MVHADHVDLEKRNCQELPGGLEPNAKWKGGIKFSELLCGSKDGWVYWRYVVG